MKSIYLSLNRRRVCFLATGAMLSLVLPVLPQEAIASNGGFSLAGTPFEVAGRKTNVDPDLLYAFSCVESAVDSDQKRGYIRPYPWTLRSNGKPFYGSNKAEVEIELDRRLRLGHRSIDVGLMQINTRWHSHRVENLFDLIDPLTNLLVGANIISENLHRFPNDAYKAIGFYHSFDKERAFRYARHVVRVYSSIKQWS